MPLTKLIVVALLTLLAMGCASTPGPRPSVLAGYQRLFLTMPSHAAGFGITAPASSMRIVPSLTGGSNKAVVDQAFQALRDDLVIAGFEVVPTAAEADAVLELTMGGVRASGEADRAFVAVRDAGTGRLMAFFRARTRDDPRAVADLIDGLAEAIVIMVRDSAPSGSESF